MRAFAFFVAFLCAFFLSSSIVLGSSFLPDNDLDQYDTQLTSNVSESDFHNVLDAVEYIYSPIIESYGKTLAIGREWNNSTVNAYASQQGDIWRVQMFGGLARRPEIGVYGFALVACHEIGHHLGGYPKYKGSWAAGEGQSDFFATLVCAKKVFSVMSYNDASFMEALSEYEQDLCRYVYGDKSYDEYTTCLKSLIGGKELASLLARGARVSIATPDPKKVSKTITGYPSAQCRLDTYTVGALCSHVVWDDYKIPSTSFVYGIDNCRNEGLGRPDCWFKK